MKSCPSYKEYKYGEKSFSFQYCRAASSHINNKRYPKRKVHTNYMAYKSEYFEKNYASKSATYHVKKQHKSENSYMCIYSSY